MSEREQITRLDDTDREIIHLSGQLETPMLKAIRRHWEKTAQPNRITKEYIKLISTLVIEKRREKGLQ